MSFFPIWTSKFRYTSLTINVPYQSRSYNRRVQIFTIYNNWVIEFLKMTWSFLLGTLFLIRTNYVKYIEKGKLLVNGLFSCLHMKTFLCVRHKKCSLIGNTSICSSSMQMEFFFIYECQGLALVLNNTLLELW